MTVSLSDKIVFIPVQCVSVPYKILSLVWLNTRLLGLLSASEQFHLMDVRSGDQLESLDITCSRQGYLDRMSELFLASVFSNRPSQVRQP